MKSILTIGGEGALCQKGQEIFLTVQKCGRRFALQKSKNQICRIIFTHKCHNYMIMRFLKNIY